MRKKILLSLLGITSFMDTTAYAQAPANDACSAAIPISITSTCVNGTTINATEDAAGTASNGAPTSGVWYKFTATTPVTEITAIPGSTLDVALLFFNSCSDTIAFDGVDNAFDVGLQEVTALSTTVGQTYYILVAGFDTTAGTFCIKANGVTPPANDLCSGAINVPVTNTCVNGTNVGATSDNNTCAQDVDKGVWYKFTATSTATKVSVLANGGFDAALTVYTACGSTMAIGCTDYQISGQEEVLNVMTVIGTTYYVLIEGYNNPANVTGTFCIKAQAITPPANDACSNATNLVLGASCTSTTNVNATEDANMCQTGYTSNGVWYKFTATGTNSRLTVSSDTSFNAAVTVYAACGDTAITCTNDAPRGANETIVLSTIAGRVYYVLVEGVGTRYGQGVFCIKAEALTPPANDLCANAVNLTVGSACTNGTTIDATDDINDCFTYTKNGVWYKFTATLTNTLLKITTMDTLFDGIISVYPSCGASADTCKDSGFAGDAEEMTIPTIVGQVYYVKIAHYGTIAGNFCISASQPPLPPMNDLCANAVSLTVGAACTNGTTVGATNDANDCFSYTRNGVWYKFVATAASSTINMTTTDADLDGILSAYATCTATADSCADDGLDGASENLVVATTIGQTYYIKTSHYGTHAGAFCIKVSNTLSLGIENIATTSFQLYPNPTTNNCTIDLQNKQEATMISIYTLDGKLIDQTTTKGNYTFQTMNWAKGIYLIKALNEKGVQIQKLIVE